MRHLLGAACALLAMSAAAMPARAQTRTIEIPATSGWKHAETGIVLLPKVAGVPRTGLSANGAGELDVMAQFRSSDESISISVYIFRPALESVPVWFDRSETAILLRDIYADPSPAGPAQAFAPPRAVTASGLRRVYVPGKGPYKSTALAMMPLGQWLVAVRISSTILDPQQMDSKLSEVVAAMRWPEGVAEAPAAAPVAPCAAPLAYAKKAKMKKPDMTDALMGAMMPTLAKQAAEKGEAKPVAAFCRDLPPKPEYGVYRAPDATDAYVMALGDAGRTLSVSPSLGGLLDKSPAFGVLFGELDRTFVYPSFDKLPHPDRALAALKTASPISSSAGNDITISTDN